MPYKLEMRLGTIYLILLMPLSFSSCIREHGNYRFTCNNKHYELVKERLSYTDAQAYAQAHKAKLAEISNEDEQICIFTAITHDGGLNTEYVTCDDGGGISYVWTGINEIKKNDMPDSIKNAPPGKYWICQRTTWGYNYSNWADAHKQSEHEQGKFKIGPKATAMALSNWIGAKDLFGDSIRGKAGQWNDININNRIYFVINTGNK